MKTVTEIKKIVSNLGAFGYVPENNTEKCLIKFTKELMEVENIEFLFGQAHGLELNEHGLTFYLDKKEGAICVENKPVVEHKKPNTMIFIALILLALAFVLAMSSCTKNEVAEPQIQTVTYHVKCDDCLIYLENEKWNKTNELERSKNQHFNVKGEFELTFENTKLDSVDFSVHVSVFSPKQYIIAEAYTNDGKHVDIDGWYGLDFPNDNPLSRQATLKLK